MDKQQVINSCIEYYNKYNRQALPHNQCALPKYALDLYLEYGKKKDIPLISCIWRKCWFKPDGTINSWSRYYWKDRYVTELCFELDMMKICLCNCSLVVCKNKHIRYKIHIDRTVHI